MRKPIRSTVPAPACRLPVRCNIRKRPRNGPETTPPAAQLSEASEKRATKESKNGTAHGSIREMGQKPPHQRHISRKLPNNQPRKGPEMAQHTEASENQAADRLPHGTTYGSIRATYRQKARKWHASRKHPSNRPQRGLKTAQRTEASEKCARNRPIRGISHGSIRTISRERGRKRHSFQKHPRNMPQRNLKNGTAYGCFRETNHTAADGNAYLRVESSTVFVSRFAEAREVIAYAANSTASQITPAMSAMR